MRRAMAKEVTTLTLLVIALQLCAQLSHARKPYDFNNPDDVTELLKYYAETKCTSIGLTNTTFQQLLFYGKPIRVYTYGVQVCPPYVGFDAKTCRCQIPGFAPDPADSSPCRTLADVSYHQGKGRYTSTTFVREQGKEAKADLNALTARSLQGRQGRQALRLTGMPLAIESFVDNQLMGPWFSSLKFLPDSPSTRAVLLTDDCDKLDEVKSLELALTGGRLEVFMRFSNDSVSLRGQSCSVRPDVDGWYTVQMDSVNHTVTVTVNGQPCVSTPPGEEAVLAQTRCPLYVGGSPKDSSTVFNGWIEYFKFKKGPRDECAV